MSRIGKEPITLPKNIKVSLENDLCVVSAAQEKLELKIPQGIKLDITETIVTVTRVDDTKQLRSLHGTIRVLVNNMIVGLSEGFKKELEIRGVGYKAQMKGSNLVLNVGFSHPVERAVPQV